jgi:hypothetical protein
MSVLLNELYLKGSLVTFALNVSIGVISEHRKRVINRRVLVFLTVGVMLDISSTVLMIIGSGKIPITVHGFIGYSALMVMLTDTILAWCYRCKNGDKQISNGLNIYTKIAFGWWVVAYIVGAIMSATL